MQDRRVSAKRVGDGNRRLDRPSRASDRIVLPDSFGTRFAIFVDTEEEFDWSAPRRRENRATLSTRAIPAFQQRLSAHGVKPVYLIDHAIADCPRSVALLRAIAEAGEAEIGAQLHPWINPPFDEALTDANSFAGNLDPALEAAKVAELTRLIESGFGRRPRVYRAGRYGVGPNSAGILTGAGYQLDVSIRTHYNYAAQGGPDFAAFGVDPYWAGPESALIELPLGAAFTGRLRRYGPTLFHRLGRSSAARGVMARTGLLQRIALTPEDMPIAAAIEAVKVLLGEGTRLLSFSFHSPSLEPGHTPYVRDAADLVIFHRWWDAMLALLAARGVTPVGAGDIVAAAWDARAR